LFVVFSINTRAQELENREFFWKTAASPLPKPTVIEVTPKGLVVGEHNTIHGSERYNGLVLLRDKVNDWERIGPNGRAITDITYYKDNSILVSTFYAVDGQKGAFHSNDYGKTWEYLNNNFSSSAVSVSENVIYLGGFSHGLWILDDTGNPWEQKIGYGWYGPEIYEIASFKKSVLVSSENGVYLSNDLGQSWEKSPGLEGKNIKNICISERSVVAGTRDGSGLFVTFDSGDNWEPIEYFNGKVIDSIESYAGGFFVAYTHSFNHSMVYYSPEFNTIIETGFASPLKILDISIEYKDINTIYALTEQRIYNSDIPKFKFKEHRFLVFPLDTLNKDNVINNISSFFDHQYPLLGYEYHNEPWSANDTTYNFLGLREKIPELYYSSHNGTDFPAALNTDVLAAGSGVAHYYHCGDCGNTIKIDHGNGYQSVYMHLNYSDLIVTSGSVITAEGQKIGSVGLTGRTTGPHLHFQIVKDTDSDNYFSDEFPIGNTDPFGWESVFFTDPWKNYTWSDRLGDHTGTESFYLWKDKSETTVHYSQTGTNRIEYRNKSISYDSSLNSSSITITLRDNKQPYLGTDHKGLMYVPQTSMIVNAYNRTNEVIEILEDPFKLKVYFDDSTLNNINPTTISFYFHNKFSDKWEKMETILDLTNKFATTVTSHLSEFALLGQKIDPSAPTTKLIISGNSTPEGWYLGSISIDFVVEDSDTEQGEINTLYMFGNMKEFEVYESPANITSPGIYSIKYRSVDSFDNYEKENEKVIKIANTQEKIKRKKIVNSSFNISTIIDF
jgi:murein DD-endopeptidase MepM/ murein hydrolase activator NlpD